MNWSLVIAAVALGISVLSLVISRWDRRTERERNLPLVAGPDDDTNRMWQHILSRQRMR